MIREHHPRRRSPESSHRWSPESSRRRRREARDARDLQLQSRPIPAPVVRYDERAEPTDERARALSPLSTSSSTSSSLLNISRPSGRFGLGRFFSGTSRKQHRVKKKRSRILKFGNSSSSSVNSDLAYGRGYIERRRSREFSPPESQHGRPSLSRRRAQTDDEILELGRKFAEIARQQNAEDLRAAGRTRPSALIGAASALSQFRRTNSGNSNRGGGISKIRRDSSPDDSEWESASDDESSSEFDSGLAYGSGLHLPGSSSKPVEHRSSPRPSHSPRSPRSPRSPQTLRSPPLLQALRHDPPLHRKPSVVDPNLFGPVNSLRGYVEAPCGFEKVDRSTISEPRQPYEPSIPPSEAVSETRPLQRVYPVPTSDPTRFDARDSVVSSQQDLPVRPRPAPLPIQPPTIQQPKPIAPVSRKVLDSVETESRYSDRALSRNAVGEAAVGGIAGAAVSALLGRDRRDGRDKHEGRHDREGKRRSKRSDDERGDKRKSRGDLRETREIHDERLERRREKLPEQDRDSERERRRQERIVAEAERESEEKRIRDKFRDVVEEYNRVREQRGDDWVDDRKPDRKVDHEEGPREERREADRTSRSDLESYKRMEGPSYAPREGPIDPFQFQVADDAFQTPLHTTPKRPLTPNVITVDREPDFSRFELHGDDAQPLERLSRKDSYERELQEAQALYKATEKSTAPVNGAAFAAAAAAVIAEDHRGRSHSRGGDASSRNRSRREESPKRERDTVLEDANRYYREAELARRIREDEKRSGTKDESSVVDKWKQGREQAIVEIVAPPEMDHPKKKSPYDGPDADVRIDNILEHPRELSRFQSPPAKGLFEPPVFRIRDPSAERERPMLNIVRPTPVPTPVPKERRPTRASSQPAKEVDASTSRTTPDVVTESRGEDVPAPPTPKAVSWGENQTKHYVVESPEREDDPYSGAKIVTPAKSPRSRLGKKSAWEVITGAMGGISNGAASSSIPDLSIDAEETKTRQTSRDPEKPTHHRSSAQIESAYDSPPIPGPKPPSPRSVQMPGSFAEDPAFTANIAAALEGSGFDPNIVIDDASFHRRESPPSSNDEGTYRSPFVESVTDLGMTNASRPGTSQNGPEHGFVIGEVAETPDDEKDIPTENSQILSMLNKRERRKQEKGADRDVAEKPEVIVVDGKPTETSRPAAEDDWDSPSNKISKKEKKRREKAAKARAMEDEKAANDASRNEYLEAEFLGADVDEDDDTSLKRKKSKKSKKAIVVQEDSRQPEVSESSKIIVPVDAFQDVQDAKAEKSTKVTVPVDAFQDVQEAKAARLEDTRESPKKNRRYSRPDTEPYDSPSVSTSKSEIFGDNSRTLAKADVFSTPDDEWDLSRTSRRSQRHSVSYGSPRSVPASELSMESSYRVIDTDSIPPIEEEWDAPKSKSQSNRDNGAYDSPSRSGPASEASLELTRKVTGSDTERDSPKKSRRSKRFSIDDEFAAPIAQGIDDADTPKKSKKKSKRDSVIYDSPSRIEPIAEDIVESPKEMPESFSDWRGDKAPTTEDGDTPRKSKKKSKRGSNIYDDSPSTPISQSGPPSDVSPTSSKKSKYDFYPDSPSRSTPTSEMGADDSRKKSKKKKRRSTPGGFPDDEGNPNESEPPDRGRDPFGIADRDASSVVSTPTRNDSHQSSKIRVKDDIADDTKSVTSAPGSADRKDRKGSKSEKDKKSSGNSSFFDRFKSSIGRAEDKERLRKSEEDRRNSFLDNADTLGAGVGSTSADATSVQESRSNATNASLEEETPTIPFTPKRQSTQLLEAEFIDPEIAPREIRPAIDPNHRDLLPLPPSRPGSPVSELGDTYPALPDSRPESPEHERHLLEMPTHARRRSETPTRPKTPSQSAIPIQFRIGHRHTPSNGKSSPIVSPIVGTPEWENDTRPRSRSRPISWEGSREFKPLFLLQKTSRGSIGSIGSPDMSSSPEREASPSSKLHDVWPSESEIGRERRRALSHLSLSEPPNRDLQLRESVFGTPVESTTHESAKIPEVMDEAERSQITDDSGIDKPSDEPPRQHGNQLEDSHLPPLPEQSTLDVTRNVETPSPKSMHVEPIASVFSTDLHSPIKTEEPSNVHVIPSSPIVLPAQERTDPGEIFEDSLEDNSQNIPTLVETPAPALDEPAILSEPEGSGVGQEKEITDSLEVPNNDVLVSDVVSGVRTPGSVDTFDTAVSNAGDRDYIELNSSLEQIQEDYKLQDGNLSDGDEMLELSTYLDALPSMEETALPSDNLPEQAPAVEQVESPVPVDIFEKDIPQTSEQVVNDSEPVEAPLSEPLGIHEKLPVEEAPKEVIATPQPQPEASNTQQATGTTSKKSKKKKKNRKSQVTEPSLDHQPVTINTQDSTPDKDPVQLTEDAVPADNLQAPVEQVSVEDKSALVEEPATIENKSNTADESPTVEPEVSTTELELVTVGQEPARIEKEFTGGTEDIAQPETSTVHPDIPSLDSERTVVETDAPTVSKLPTFESEPTAVEPEISVSPPKHPALESEPTAVEPVPSDIKAKPSTTEPKTEQKPGKWWNMFGGIVTNITSGIGRKETQTSEVETSTAKPGVPPLESERTVVEPDSSTPMQPSKLDPDLEPALVKPATSTVEAEPVIIEPGDMDIPPFQEETPAVSKLTIQPEQTNLERKSIVEKELPTGEMESSIAEAQSNTLEQDSLPVEKEPILSEERKPLRPTPALEDAPSVSKKEKKKKLKGKKSVAEIVQHLESLSGSEGSPKFAGKPKQASTSQDLDVPSIEPQISGQDQLEIVTSQEPLDAQPTLAEETTPTTPTSKKSKKKKRAKKTQTAELETEGANASEQIPSLDQETQPLPTEPSVPATQEVEAVPPIETQTLDSSSRDVTETLVSREETEYQPKPSTEDKSISQDAPIEKSLDISETSHNNEDASREITAPNEPVIQSTSTGLKTDALHDDQLTLPSDLGQKEEPLDASKPASESAQLPSHDIKPKKSAEVSVVHEDLTTQQEHEVQPTLAETSLQDPVEEEPSGSKSLEYTDVDESSLQANVLGGEHARDQQDPASIDPLETPLSKTDPTENLRDKPSEQIQAVGETAAVSVVADDVQLLSPKEAVAEESREMALSLVESGSEKSSKGKKRQNTAEIVDTPATTETTQESVLQTATPEVNVDETPVISDNVPEKPLQEPIEPIGEYSRDEPATPSKESKKSKKKSKDSNAAGLTDEPETPKIEEPALESQIDLEIAPELVAEQAEPSEDVLLETDSSNKKPEDEGEKTEEVVDAPALSGERELSKAAEEVVTVETSGDGGKSIDTNVPAPEADRATGSQLETDQTPDVATTISKKQAKKDKKKKKRGSIQIDTPTETITSDVPQDTPETPGVQGDANNESISHTEPVVNIDTIAGDDQVRVLEQYDDISSTLKELKEEPPEASIVTPELATEPSTIPGGSKQAKEEEANSGSISSPSSPKKSKKNKKKRQSVQFTKPLEQSTMEAPGEPATEFPASDTMFNTDWASVEIPPPPAFQQKPDDHPDMPSAADDPLETGHKPSEHEPVDPLDELIKHHTEASKQSEDSSNPEDGPVSQDINISTISELPIQKDTEDTMDAHIDKPKDHVLAEISARDQTDNVQRLSDEAILTEQQGVDVQTHDETVTVKEPIARDEPKAIPVPQEQDSSSKEASPVDIAQVPEVIEEPLEIQTEIPDKTLQADESTLVAPIAFEDDQPKDDIQHPVPSDLQLENPSLAQEETPAVVEETPVVTKKSKKEKKKRKSKGQDTLDPTEGSSTPIDSTPVEEPNTDVLLSEQVEPKSTIAENQPEADQIVPDFPMTTEPEELASQAQEPQPQESQPQEESLPSPVSKKSKKNKKKKRASQVQEPEPEPSILPTQDPTAEQLQSPVHDSELQNVDSSSLPQGQETEIQSTPAEEYLPTPEVVETTADVPDAHALVTKESKSESPDTSDVPVQPKDIEQEPVAQIEKIGDDAPFVETENEPGTVPSGDITESRDQKETDQTTDIPDNAVAEKQLVIEPSVLNEEVSEAATTPKSKKSKKKKKRSSQAALDDAASVPSQEPTQEPSQGASQDVSEPVLDVQTPIGDVTSSTGVAIPSTSEHVPITTSDKMDEPVEPTTTVIRQEIPEPILESVPESQPEVVTDVNNTAELEPKSALPDQPTFSSQVEELELQSTKELPAEEANTDEDNKLPISKDAEVPQENAEQQAEDKSAMPPDQQTEMDVSTPVEASKDEDLARNNDKEAKRESVQDDTILPVEPSQAPLEPAGDAGQLEASTSISQPSSKGVDTVDIVSPKKSKKDKKKKKASRVDGVQSQEQSQAQSEPEPTIEQTTGPTAEPVVEPSIEPVIEPTNEPTAELAIEPVVEPATELTAKPEIESANEPIVEQVVDLEAKPDVSKELEPEVPAPESSKGENVEPAPSKKSKKEKKKKRASLREGEMVSQEAQEEPAQTTSDPVDVTPTVEPMETKEADVPEPPKDDNTPDITTGKKGKKNKKKKRASIVGLESEPATPVESEPVVTDQTSELPTEIIPDNTAPASTEDVILAEEGTSTTPSEIPHESTIVETPITSAQDDVTLAEESLSTVPPVEVVEEQTLREPSPNSHAHIPDEIPTKDITTAPSANELIAEAVAEPEVVSEIPEEQSKNILPAVSEERSLPLAEEPVQPTEKTDDILQDATSAKQSELIQPEEPQKPEESLQPTEPMQLEESLESEEPVQTQELPTPEPAQIEKLLSVDDSLKPQELEKVEETQQADESAQPEFAPQEPLEAGKPVQLEELSDTKDLPKPPEPEELAQVEGLVNANESEHLDESAQLGPTQEVSLETDEPMQLEVSPIPKDSQQPEENVQAEEASKAEEPKQLDELAQPEPTPEIPSETQEPAQLGEHPQPEDYAQPSEPEEITQTEDISNVEEPRQLDELVQPESTLQEDLQAQEPVQTGEPIQQSDSKELPQPEVLISQEFVPTPKSPKPEEPAHLEQPMEPEKSLDSEELVKGSETVQPEESVSMSEVPSMSKDPVQLEEPLQQEESAQLPLKPDESTQAEESVQPEESVLLAEKPPVTLDESEVVPTKKSKKDKKKKKKASQAELEPTPESIQPVEQPKAQTALPEQPAEQEISKELTIPPESLLIGDDVATTLKEIETPEDVLPETTTSKKSKKKKKRASQLEPELQPPEVAPLPEEPAEQSLPLEQPQESQQANIEPATEDAVLSATDAAKSEDVFPEVSTEKESNKKIELAKEPDQELQPDTTTTEEPQKQPALPEEPPVQESAVPSDSQPKIEEPVITDVITKEEGNHEDIPEVVPSKKSKKERRKAKKQASLVTEPELERDLKIDNELATPEAASSHTERLAEQAGPAPEAETPPTTDKILEDSQKKNLQPTVEFEPTAQLDQDRALDLAQNNEETTASIDQARNVVPSAEQDPNVPQEDEVAKNAPAGDDADTPIETVQEPVDDSPQSPAKDVEKPEEETPVLDILETSSKDVLDANLQSENPPDTEEQDKPFASGEPMVTEEPSSVVPKDVPESSIIPETSETKPQERTPADQDVKSDVPPPNEQEPESSPVTRKKSKKDKKKKKAAQAESESASGAQAPSNRELNESITNEPVTQEPGSVIVNEGEWPESPTKSKKNKKRRKASGTSTPLESMEDTARAPSDTIKEENVPGNPTLEEISEVEGQSSKSKDIQEQEILSVPVPQDENAEDVNISHPAKENVAASENDQVTSLTEDEQRAQDDGVPANDPVQDDPVHFELSTPTSPPRTPITTALPTTDIDLSPAQLSSHVEHDRPFDQSSQPGKKARTRLSTDDAMISEPLSVQANVPPQLLEGSSHDSPEPVQFMKDNTISTGESSAFPQDVTPAREIAASYLESKPISTSGEHTTVEENTDAGLIGTSGLLPEITPQREIAASYFEGYHPSEIQTEDKKLEDGIQESVATTPIIPRRDTPASHLELDSVEEKTLPIESEGNKQPSPIQDAILSAREVAADIMDSRSKSTKKKETPEDEDLTATKAEITPSPSKASTPKKAKKGKKQKYVDKRAPDTDDMLDDPALWESSERRTLEGGQLDADAGDFWTGPSTEVEDQDKTPSSDPMEIEQPNNPPAQDSIIENVESPVVGREIQHDLPKAPDNGHVSPPSREPPTTEIIEKLDDLDTSGQTSEASEPIKEQKVDDGLLKSLSPKPLTQDFLSSGRASPRVLPPVEEETHEDLEKDEKSQEFDSSDKGSIIIDPNRDSGFVTDSPNPMRRSFVDELKLRDSGVHLHETPESTPQRKAELREEERTAIRTPVPNERRTKKPGLQSETPKLETPVARSQEGELQNLTDPKKTRSVGQRSVSENISRGSTPRTEDQPMQPRRSASNTSISRFRTPEPLRFRPESPGSYSGIRSGTNTPPLRRMGKRMSGDLRSLGSNLSNVSNGSASKENLHQQSTTPVANEGRVRAKDMTDVYDGYGEGRIGSPRSPTRPQSMRRRQSMQVLELESRVEQLLVENRALSDAKSHAEQHFNQRAASAITERDAEIESLKASLEWLRKEVTRLTEVNDGLHSANKVLALQHNEKYGRLESQNASISKELDEHRFTRGQYTKTIQEKDAEIQELRAQLEATKEQVREMQRQILAQKPPDADFLRLKDEDHFDHRCQQLCAHVQQWVLRFSKFSDMRACRLTSEINDEKIIDRLDNSILDGSDVDDYLSDRVRRRDIFMSMTMNMVWEFVFTRYLFGMDREQRQKLKSLEKLLVDVGPPHAVRQWRAVTLTLLSRRPAFGDQRNQDTEAVVQAVFQTLSMILPPPSNMESQIQSQLRRVMREAVDLSVEMRTQRAEYMMLPPLQPEYDANGDLAHTVSFNASLMNERSGGSVTNDEYEAQGAVVRTVLFPLVVKKGDDNGVGDEEIVICPAQVLVAKPPRHGTVRMVTPSSEAGGVPLSRGATPSVSARGAQSTVSLQMQDAPLPIPTPPHESDYL